MASFPQIEPATRKYTMGVFPVTEETGFGGGSIRFKHGNTSYGHQLELGYVSLTQAEANAIRAHYRLQQGGFLSFSLSAAVWTGHTSLFDLVPATTWWCYSSPINETHNSGGFVDLTVSLISVPAVFAGTAFGSVQTVTATLAAGSASAH